MHEFCSLRGNDEDILMLLPFSYNFRLISVQVFKVFSSSTASEVALVPASRLSLWNVSP